MTYTFEWLDGVYDHRPLRTLSVHLTAPDDWIMAVVRAYIDDSGSPSDPNHTYITMAGYSCAVQEWNRFEKKWGEILKVFNIPYLHMREFAKPNSIYEHIKADDEAMRHLFMMLINAIHHGTLVGFDCSIHLNDLRAFSEHHGINLDAHSMALYGCFLNLLVYNEEYRDEKIEIVVDRFDRSHQKLSTAMDYSFSDTQAESGAKVLSMVCLLDDQTYKNVYPLQAADFLAWESRKNLEDNKGFKPTYEERKVREKLSEAYAQYSREHQEIFNNSPRERVSYRELLAGMGNVISSVWTRDDLEQSLKRHPNGWTS